MTTTKFNGRKPCDICLGIQPICGHATGLDGMSEEDLSIMLRVARQNTHLDSVRSSNVLEVIKSKLEPYWQNRANRNSQYHWMYAAE